MRNKVCPKCKTEKTETDFGIRYKGIRYEKIIRSYCKQCEREFKNKYDKENKEKVLLSARNRYIKNREKERERHRLYREKNIEMLREKDRDRKVERLIKQKERTKNDPEFRIKRSISACIRERLKSRLIGKNYRTTFSFLPYTTAELMTHLEKLFKPGMTWDNYGYRGWHIDHVIPDSNFKYISTLDIEFQKCWSLDNLQPLWAIENMKKGNRIL